MDSSNLKRGSILLTILVTLILCGTASAQTSDPSIPKPLILTDEREEYPLGLYMEILEDPSGELTIEDVSSPEFNSRFIPSQVAVPNYGFTNSVYWVRLGLENKTQDTEEWLLEQGFANTHYIDLYSPLPDNKGFEVKQTGVLRPVSTRDVLFPHIVFSLTIPPQSQQTTYLRLKSGASMTLLLTLWTRAAFMNHALVQHTLMGIFFGVMFGLLFYNLFLLFTLREVSYLYFVILLTSVIFEEASYDGYLQVYITPDLSIPIQFIEPVALPLMIGSMVLFAGSFLDLKRRLPKLHTATLGVLAVWGLLILLIPFTSYLYLASLMAPWALVSLVVILIAGIASWKGGYQPSRYFMLAWLGLVISVIWVLLVRLGLASSTLLSENAFRVGYLWMAICWSFALSDRINLLKVETEKANRDLQNSQHNLSQILEGLPIGVVVYGEDRKAKYINRRTVEILNNPAKDIRADPSAGRTLEQAIRYFSLKLAGSDFEYPLEKYPVYQALHGKPASTDDIEADQGDRRIPLEVWANPVRDDKGNVESAVVAFQDISSRKQTEMALQISEARFRVIAENNFDGIAFLGRDRKVLYVSPSYLRLVGKTAEELIGQTGIGLVHPDDQDYTEKKFNELLQQPNTRISAEYRIPYKDGSYIWVETLAINMLDNPYVQAVVLNSHDISDRKQRETELADYREDLETLVESRTDELNAVNEQLNLRLEWLSAINFVNQIMYQSADFTLIYYKILNILNKLFITYGSFISEWKPEIGQLQILIHSCSSDTHTALRGTHMKLPECIQTDPNWERGEPCCISKDQLSSVGGTLSNHFQFEKILNVVFVPLELRGQFLGCLGFEFLEEDRNFSKEEVELISIFSSDIAQVIEDSHMLEQTKANIVKEERNRLARDLHDSVTQTLFTASVIAEATPRIWNKDENLARNNLERLSQLIRGALAEMRFMLIELRSGEMGEQTIGQLLHTLVEALKGRSKIIVAESITDVYDLPDTVISAFYRAAREALNNVIVHSGATNLQISLNEADDQITMRIKDDGEGFNPQAVEASHLGVRMMEERAAEIGGDLKVQSQPGQGTEVIMAWSKPAGAGVQDE